jgi:uncharacterized protein YdaU (DUF1376 family)
MSNRAWMPLYVADYLADTQDLTAQEHGAYLLLLMHYWQRGSLPDDDGVLARIARIHPPHWPKIKKVLMRFLMHQDPGVLINQRMERELRKAHEISNKRKLSAQQMHSTRKAFASANAQQLHTHAGARHNHIDIDTTSVPVAAREGAVEQKGRTTPGKLAASPELSAVIERKSRGVA